MNKTIKQLLIIAIIVLFILVILVWLFNSWKVDVNIIAASISGIVIICGYFLAHFFETERKQKENKLERYLALIRSYRGFFGEPDTTSEELKQQREDFQKAYLESTLFISKESYDAFSKVLQRYIESSKTQRKATPEEIKEFEELQSNFINALRSEIVPDDKIDFRAYRIHIRPETLNK